MKWDRVLYLMQIERQCVINRAANKCDGTKCAECELVQKDTDLMDAYTEVISLLYYIKQRWK
jgi:hypothetical protein